MVFVANVLKCRPPGNRDPHAGRDRGLRKPPVPAGRAHRAQGRCRRLATSRRSFFPGSRPGSRGSTVRNRKSRSGSRKVLLYPLYHPAAALYTPSMLTVLQEDFRRLPELLGRVVEPPGSPSRCSSPSPRSSSGFSSLSATCERVVLAGGDRAHRREARRRAAARRRRHRLGRARLGQDDVRPRRLPRSRGRRRR